MVSAWTQDGYTQPSSHWRIEIQAPDARGSLPTGGSLTLFLHVSGGSPTQPESLVAIVEGPSLPKRLYPLVPDAQSGDLSTTVEVEVASLGSIGEPPKAIPVSVMIAHIRGMALAHIGKRTVYVTLGAPTTGNVSLAGAPFESVPAQHHGRPAGFRSEPTAQTALGQESVREENLVHPSPLNGSHAYWKRVNDLIGLSLRERMSAQPPSRARRNPGVRFRLFANGEAQLIQLEQSSEDPRVDEAAMLAVIDAHPFPPFPEDATDPYLDVHVVLPVLAP
jgi:TonB family protein